MIVVNMIMTFIKKEIIFNVGKMFVFLVLSVFPCPLKIAVLNCCCFFFCCSSAVLVFVSEFATAAPPKGGKQAPLPKEEGRQQHQRKERENTVPHQKKEEEAPPPEREEDEKQHQYREGRRGPLWTVLAPPLEWCCCHPSFLRGVVSSLLGGAGFRLILGRCRSPPLLSSGWCYFSLSCFWAALLFPLLLLGGTASLLLLSCSCPLQIDTLDVHYTCRERRAEEAPREEAAPQQRSKGEKRAPPKRREGRSTTTQEEEAESCTTPQETGLQHCPQRRRCEGKSNISPQEGDTAPFGLLSPSLLGAVLLCVLVGAAVPHPPYIQCKGEVRQGEGKGTGLKVLPPSSFWAVLPSSLFWVVVLSFSVSFWVVQFFEKCSRNLIKFLLLEVAKHHQGVRETATPAKKRRPQPQRAAPPKRRNGRERQQPARERYHHQHGERRNSPQHKRIAENRTTKDPKRRMYGSTRGEENGASLLLEGAAFLFAKASPSSPFVDGAAFPRSLEPWCFAPSFFELVPRSSSPLVCGGCFSSLLLGGAAVSSSFWYNLCCLFWTRSLN